MSMDRETKKLMEAWSKMQGEGIGAEIVPNAAKEGIQPVRQVRREDDGIGYGDDKNLNADMPAPKEEVGASMLGAVVEVFTTWIVHKDSEHFDSYMTEIYKGLPKKAKAIIQQQVRLEADM